jgi:hypothetical protein
MPLRYVHSDGQVARHKIESIPTFNELHILRTSIDSETGSLEVGVRGLLQWNESCACAGRAAGLCPIALAATSDTYCYSSSINSF